MIFRNETFRIPSDGHGNLATGRWIGFVFILLVPLLGEAELEELGFRTSDML